MEAAQDQAIQDGSAIIHALDDIQTKIDKLIQVQSPVEPQDSSTQAQEILRLEKELSDEKERHQETLRKLQESDSKINRLREKLNKGVEVFRKLQKDAVDAVQQSRTKMGLPPLDVSSLGLESQAQAPPTLVSEAQNCSGTAAQTAEMSDRILQTLNGSSTGTDAQSSSSSESQAQNSADSGSKTQSSSGLETQPEINSSTDTRAQAPPAPASLSQNSSGSGSQAQTPPTPIPQAQTHLPSSTVDCSFHTIMIKHRQDYLASLKSTLPPNLSSESQHLAELRNALFKINGFCDQTCALFESGRREIAKLKDELKAKDAQISVSNAQNQTIVNLKRKLKFLLISCLVAVFGLVFMRF